jgi:uncharacterized protein YjiS (DUF1127 family)
MMLRWFWLQMQRRQSSRMLRELTDEQLSDIGQRRSSNGKVSPRPTDRLDER